MSGTEIVQETSDLKMHAISCLAPAFMIFSLHVQCTLQLRFPSESLGVFLLCKTGSRRLQYSS